MPLTPAPYALSDVESRISAAIAALDVSRYTHKTGTAQTHPQETFLPLGVAELPASLAHLAFFVFTASAPADPDRQTDGEPLPVRAQVDVTTLYRLRAGGNSSQMDDYRRSKEYAEDIAGAVLALPWAAHDAQAWLENAYEPLLITDSFVQARIRFLVGFDLRLGRSR